MQFAKILKMARKTQKRPGMLRNAQEIYDRLNTHRNAMERLETFKNAQTTTFRMLRNAKEGSRMPWEAQERSGVLRKAGIQRNTLELGTFKKAQKRK